MIGQALVVVVAWLLTVGGLVGTNDLVFVIGLFLLFVSLSLAP